MNAFTVRSILDRLDGGLVRRDSAAQVRLLNEWLVSTIRVSGGIRIQFSSLVTPSAHAGGTDPMFAVVQFS